MKEERRGTVGTDIAETAGPWLWQGEESADGDGADGDGGIGSASNDERSGRPVRGTQVPVTGQTVAESNGDGGVGYGTSEETSGTTVDDADRGDDDAKPRSIVERVEEVLQRDEESDFCEEARRGATATEWVRTDADGAGSTVDAGQDREPYATSDTELEANGPDRDLTEVRECQNCAGTAVGRHARSLGPADVTVDLCLDCQTAATVHERSLDDCRSGSVPVAVAAAEACEACGATGRLESHAVVPVDDGGFRHSNNVLALCPDCHAAVEWHSAVERHDDSER